jgi:hypothetical protein
LVGAQSPICPRCGVTFRTVVIRKFIVRVALAVLIVWCVAHFGFRII